MKQGRAPIGLMLRSVAQRRVSKHGAVSSFETRSFGALLRMRAGRDAA